MTKSGNSGNASDMSVPSPGSESENFSSDRTARLSGGAENKGKKPDFSDMPEQANSVLNRDLRAEVPSVPGDVSDRSTSKKRRRKRRRRRGGANVGHQPSALAVDGATQANANNTNAGTGSSVSQNKAVAAGSEVKRTSVQNPQTQKNKDHSSGSAKNGNDQGRKPHASRHQTYPANDAYAALDLGTNNCRLLVAVPTRPGNFRVVDAFSRIVRLGEGFGATGRLSDAAMGRAIEALKICRDKLYARPIQRMRLIATEACRSALNSAEFLANVEAETGLKLEIVNRETEARLAVSGCTSLVDRSAKSIILFDIGGGSSEIALVDAQNHRGGRLANHIRAWTSLPVGVVTMAEKFGGEHVSHEKFNDMVEYALNLLHYHGDPDLMASSVSGHNGDHFHLIGTSGTVTTLAGIHLDLPRYDRRRVDGLWMSSKQIDMINTKLLDWTFEQRSANACIGKDRADLVLAGCAILEAIRRTWPSERLRVADRGLREGILTEMMTADGVWHRRSRGYNRSWKLKDK